jgi:hypothetical protein
MCLNHLIIYFLSISLYSLYHMQQIRNCRESGFLWMEMPPWDLTLAPTANINIPRNQSHFTHFESCHQQGKKQRWIKYIRNAIPHFSLQGFSSPSLSFDYSLRQLKCICFPVNLIPALLACLAFYRFTLFLLFIYQRNHEH